MPRKQSIQTLLVLLSLLFIFGCASLPDPPKGNTCIGDVAQGGFDCMPIPQSSPEIEQMFEADPETIIVQVKLRAKSDGSFVPFSAVDNWVAFDPDTWSSIQEYIGNLKVIAQRKCQ